MTIPAAVLEPLFPRFRAWARQCAKFATADDYEAEMYKKLLELHRDRPERAAWLLAQRPSYIAQWAAGAARPLEWAERRHALGIPDGRKYGAQPVVELSEGDAVTLDVSPMEAEEEALWKAPLFAHLASLYA